MTRPLGDCPTCGHDWGRHSMPAEVKHAVMAGEVVEGLNTCPFCDCRNMELPPLLIESAKRVR